MLTSPFSSYFELVGALFWDRRRPRLHRSRLTDLSGDECRRGRLPVPEERVRDPGSY